MSESKIVKTEESLIELVESNRDLMIKKEEEEEDEKYCKQLEIVRAAIEEAILDGKTIIKVHSFLGKDAENFLKRQLKLKISNINPAEPSFVIKF
jgi:hypothetical protein